MAQKPSNPATDAASQQSKDSLVVEAMKARGKLYLTTFRELSNRFGEDTAKDIMGAVSYAIGLQEGATLSCHAPSDFNGILKDFFETPDEGKTFATRVCRLDDDGLEVKQMACPLRESWHDAGCSDTEIQALLSCATQFDKAVFDAAGFNLDLEPWAPGRSGCCHAVITRKDAATTE